MVKPNSNTVQRAVVYVLSELARKKVYVVCTVASSDEQSRAIVDAGSGDLMNVDSAEGESVSGVCTTGCLPVMTVVVYADVGVSRRQRLSAELPSMLRALAIRT